MTDQEFTACAKRYLDMVYRIALNWFGPPQRADAEDAAQNTMLRLYRTDTAFESEDHLRYWLARVTLNECKRLSSSLWRLRTVPLDACPEPVFSDPGLIALPSLLLTISLLDCLFFFLVFRPSAGLPQGVQGPGRPIGALPSPPPWGWSLGFITEPRTVGRMPM